MSDYAMVEKEAVGKTQSFISSSVRRDDRERRGEGVEQEWMKWAAGTRRAFDDARRHQEKRDTRGEALETVTGTTDTRWMRTSDFIFASCFLRFRGVPVSDMLHVWVVVDSVTLSSVSVIFVAPNLCLCQCLMMSRCIDFCSS